MKESTTRPKKLFAAALAHIKKHPKKWDQACPLPYDEEYRPCPCCFLAHVRRLAYGDKHTSGTFGPAMKALKISELEARWLFHTSRTISDFEYFFKHWKIKETSV